MPPVGIRPRGASLRQRPCPGRRTIELELAPKNLTVRYPTSTHTYAAIPVSTATYAEIAGYLLSVGYGHCINDKGEIDLHGLALVNEEKK